MLRSVARALSLLSILAAPVLWAQTALDTSVAFEIPAQSLQNALLELSRQSSCQIVFSSPAYSALHAHAVSGTMSVRQALERLLAGTGLAYKLIGENTITVAPQQEPAAPVTPGTGARANNDTQEGRPKPQSVAPAGGSVSPPQTDSAAGQAAPAADAIHVQEVIVTAQKRFERLQEVPISVTAISGETLTNQNQLRVQDYASTVPGLSVAPAAVQGIQVVSIRGITTGGGSNPTVGIVVDDVPYGASTALAGGLTIPDLDPSDLARVEILRGPQGTLYGASSMGGLLKYVTVDPSVTDFSARMQAGVLGIHNGSEAGYNLRGSVNLPVTDTFALRASGFMRQDPGYIDNPILGIRGVNADRVRGGRLSSLWKVSDAVSIKLSALYQNAKGDGNSDIDAPTAGFPQTNGLAGLQQNYVRGIGAYDRKVQTYSAIVNARMAQAELTAVTGYNINSFRDSWDYSFALGDFLQPAFGVAGAPVFDDNKTRKLSQELRLSLPLGARFDWLVGAFYTHETTSFTQDITAADPLSGQIVSDSILFLSFPAAYSELAGFTDLTYHVTDRLDVQVGAREGHITQTSAQTETGPLAPESLTIFPEQHSSSNAFTYLLTPRLKLSPDLMIYARFASGYRAGGPNLSPGGDVPLQYQPDKTYDYELGFKGDLTRNLSLETSLYYIDWRAIQIQLFSEQSQLDYNTNGSRARSEGLEVSLQWQPLRGLQVASWLALSNAVLTRGFPPATTAYGAAGDKLPYNARVTANISVQQEFPISGRASGSVGFTASYVGDRKDVFTSPPPAVPPRQDLPGYIKVDLHAGARFDSWSVNAFVNNLFDRRGLVTGGLGNVPPFSFVYIQPRTAGVSIAKEF